MNIRLPIYFTPVLKNMVRIQDSITAIVNLTQSKSTGLVISNVTAQTIIQTQIIYDNFVDLVQNLPNHDITQYHRKKNAFLIHFLASQVLHLVLLIRLQLPPSTRKLLKIFITLIYWLPFLKFMKLFAMIDTCAII